MQEAADPGERFATIEITRTASAGERFAAIPTVGWSRASEAVRLLEGTARAIGPAARSREVRASPSSGLD
jgi:hypothetical protein